MKKIYLLLAWLVVSISAVNAQKVTFDNVLKVYLRSAGPIIDQKEVTGYYQLYNYEKADRKNNVYKLIILDANLNKVAEKEITDSKNVFISDATYNGDFLAIKFLNMKDEQQILRIYDKSTKEVSKKEYPAEKKAYVMSGLMFGGSDDDEIESTDLHPLPHKGFLNFTPTITKGGMVARTGTNIQMIGTAPGYTFWEYNTPEKEIEIPFYLMANNDVAFMTKIKKEKYTSKEMNYSLAGYDLKSGKILFDKELTDPAYQLDVINAVYLEETNENIVFGTLLDKDTKDRKDDTHGLFAAKIDNKGNVISKTNILWTDFAKTFNPVDEKGKPINIGNVYIHKVVKTADGRIFAIGERFRKAASALGIASMIMGGGRSNTSVVKIVLEDMVVIEFDANFKPVKMSFYNKGKTNVDGLPAGVGMLGNAILGMYIKNSGWFDYSFTQERTDRSSFSVGYTYRDKEEKTNYFGTINYHDGQFTTDKISLKTDATTLKVFPGKPGYINIQEYYKKLKKIDSRLEKINF